MIQYRKVLKKVYRQIITYCFYQGLFYAVINIITRGFKLFYNVYIIIQSCNSHEKKKFLRYLAIY